MNFAKSSQLAGILLLPFLLVAMLHIAQHGWWPDNDFYASDCQICHFGHYPGIHTELSVTVIDDFVTVSLAGRTIVARLPEFTWLQPAVRAPPFL